MSLLQDLTILKLFGNLINDCPWGVVEGSSPLKNKKIENPENNIKNKAGPKYPGEGAIQDSRVHSS